MYEAYVHTDVCRHSPPPNLMVSFPPLTRSGIVVCTSRDAVAVVERAVAGFTCNHVRAVLAPSVDRVRFARKCDADFVGFVGDLDGEAYGELANLGATGYVVLMAAPCESYDAIVSRLRATDDGPYVSEFARLD